MADAPPPYSPSDSYNPNSANLPHRQQYLTNIPSNSPSDTPLESSIGSRPRQPSIPIPPLPRTSTISPSRPEWPGPNSLPIEELDRAGFVSASSYFALRAPVQARPRNVFYHHMTLSPDSRAENMPFPQPIETWTGREVDGHDWATFLSFLLSPFGAEGRKETQELETDADLDLAGLRLSNAKSRDQARPLLGGDSAGPSAGGQDRELERLRRMRVDAVSSQWNEGFFGPRGLQILINNSNSAVSSPVETAPKRSTSNVLQKKPPPEAEETFLHQAVGKGKRSQVKQLLEKGGEEIEALNKKGETCLFRAVYKGDKDIVQLLLEHGADPAARPPGAESPLHIACSNDKKTIVKYLVDTGKVDTREPSSKGETPLYVAVSRRQKDCIEILLGAGSDPNARPSGKDSMLNLAVSSDSKSIVKALVATGRVGIEEANSKGETPLYAAVLRRQKDIIENLLDAGANPNARPVDKDSMLNLAVTNDAKSIATMLLQKGVAVEELKGGETPLCRCELFSRRALIGEKADNITAISRGQTAMTRLLLEYGASTAFRTAKGESPLSIAVTRGDKTTVSLLLEQEKINVEVENAKHQTPLWIAVYRGHTAIAEQLLRKGAFAGKSPHGEESLLNLAVSRGNSSLTSLVLERGADVEERSRSNESPLFQAICRGDTAIVSLLLGNGANPDTRNPAGESALQRAVYRADTSVVSLLLGKGANPDLQLLGGESPLYMGM